MVLRVRLFRFVGRLRRPPLRGPDLERAAASGLAMAADPGTAFVAIAVANGFAIDTPDAADAADAAGGAPAAPTAEALGRDLDAQSGTAAAETLPEAPAPAPAPPFGTEGGSLLVLRGFRNNTLFIRLDSTHHNFLLGKIIVFS